MNEKAKDSEETRWVRLFSPIHIPKYLVEQVREREYSVEDFFKFQEINCLIQKKDGPTLNPFNHLYALVNEENIVVGFLWFVIDALTKDLIINTFSVDKDHWAHGKAVKKLSIHIKELMKKLKLKKAYWMTRYPKHSMRHGFKRSRSVLMEYELESNKEAQDGKINDGRNRLPRKSGDVEPGTTAVIQSNDDSARTGGPTEHAELHATPGCRGLSTAIPTKLCGPSYTSSPAADCTSDTTKVH